MAQQLHIFHLIEHLPVQCNGLFVLFLQRFDLCRNQIAVARRCAILLQHFQRFLRLLQLSCIGQRNGKAAVTVRAGTLLLNCKLQFLRCMVVILQFNIAVALDVVQFFH